MRHGYAAKIPYSQLLAKIAPHISNNAKKNIQDLCRDVLNLVGCEENSFKLGRSQVFFRSKSVKFVDTLLKLDEVAAKEIAEGASKKFNRRQRHALWFMLKYIGTSKLNIE